MGQHFKIVTTCCNSKQWTLKCVESIMQQIYTNWSAVIVDAKSDDGTYNMLVEETSHFDNIEILRNTKRETALFNIILAIDKLKPDNEDILVFLDGDDCQKSQRGEKVIELLGENM